MTRTLESVRAELLSEESQFASKRVAAIDIRFEPGTLCVANETIDLSAAGLERICQVIKAPFSYIEKLRSDLQADLLQYHFSQEDLAADQIELVTRGRQLVAVQCNALHRLSAVNVIDAVTDGLGSISLSVHNLELVRDSFMVDLVSDTHHTEVSAGDVVRAGLRVVHSFVGEQATSIEAYVLRLICRNGLTHRECLSRGTARTRRLPVDRPDAHNLQMQQIRRLCAEVLQSLHDKLEALKTLGRDEFEVEHVLRRWLERARLSTRTLWPRLREAWQEEGGRPTAYDAMNALTRVATHAKDLDLRTRRRLANLAGILAFRQIHFCPRCFSMVN